MSDVDLDYFTSAATARAATEPDQILLGNINPVTVLRDRSPEDVAAAIAHGHLEAAGRYIVAAGCEVPRDTPLEHFRAMTEDLECWGQPPSD